MEMSRFLGGLLPRIALVITTAIATIERSSTAPDDRPSLASLINITARHCSVRTSSKSRGVLVGALFQFHEEYSSEDDKCSRFLGWDAVEQSQTFFFASQKLRSLNSTVIDWRSLGVADPKEVLGWIVRDTCTSNVLGTIQSLDMAGESPAYVDASQQLLLDYLGEKQFNRLQAHRNCRHAKLLAIVGPASDEEVAAVSPLLTSYKIPHVSFWASSTGFNDVNRYPFLFRTVPSIEHQVTAMIDLIEYFGWNYVSVLGAQDDLYSGRGVDLIQYESRVRKFCIGQVLRFSTRDETTMREIARKLKADRQARVMILFAPLTQAKAFLDMMEEENVTEKILIGSNDWVNRLAPSGKPVLYRSTAVFGFEPHRLVMARANAWTYEIVGLSEHISAEETVEYILDSLEIDPWLRVFIENRLQCRFEGSNACKDLEQSVLGANRNSLRLCSLNDLRQIPSIPFLGRVEPLMFAMEVIAEAIEQAFLETGRTEVFEEINGTHCSLPSGDLLRSVLKRMTMPCTSRSGLCHIFSENQQVYPAFKLHYLHIGMKDYILRPAALWLGEEGKNFSTRLIWDSPPNKTLFSGFTPTSDSPQWPSSACSHQCQPGERRVFYDTRLALCCWRCDNCPDNQVSNEVNSDNCKACPLGTKPSIDSKECVLGDLVRLEYSNVLVILLSIFALVGAFLTLFTVVLFFRHRRHTLVRSSDSNITAVILIASLVSHIVSPFTIGAGRLTSTVCKFNLIATTPFKIIVIAAILVKTNRFIGIFSAAKRLKTRSRLFSTPVQMGFIMVISSVGLSLAFAYSFTVGTEIVYPSQTERRVICTSSDAWDGLLSAYHICLVIVVVILAFMTRNLPQNYNEAQQIYFAALATLVVWAGFTPAVYLTNSYLRPLIVTFSAEAQMWAVWLCIYLPRIVLLFRSMQISKRKSTFISSSVSMPGCVQVPLSEQKRHSRTEPILEEK